MISDKNTTKIKRVTFFCKQLPVLPVIVIKNNTVQYRSPCDG